MTDDSHMKIQFNRSISLRDEGRFQEAADVMIGLLAGDLTRRQRAAVTGYLAGILLYDLDRPATAEPICRESASLSPRSELASVGLFHALWALRRPLDAFTEMKRFVGGVGQSDEYERLAKEIAESTGDPDGCSRAIQAFMAGEPEPAWRHGLHEIERALDRGKE